MKNCNTCLYSNFNKDGSVICDKVLLIYGKEVYVEKDKVGLNCPSHSDYPIKETRYMRDNDTLQDAEEACGICGRLINLQDDSQYEYIAYDGSLVTQCRICKEKKRR